MRQNLILLALATLLFLNPGCASTKEEIAYKSIGAITATTDSAIGAYNDYRKSHQIPDDQVRKVREYVKVYLDALTTAQRVLEVYNNDHSKPQVVAAIDAVSAAGSDLIALIQQYTK